MGSKAIRCASFSTIFAAWFRIVVQKYVPHTSLHPATDHWESFCISLPNLAIVCVIWSMSIHVSAFLRLDYLCCHSQASFTRSVDQDPRQSYIYPLNILVQSDRTKSGYATLHVLYCVFLLTVRKLVSDNTDYVPWEHMFLHETQRWDTQRNPETMSRH